MTTKLLPLLWLRLQQSPQISDLPDLKASGSIQNTLQDPENAAAFSKLTDLDLHGLELERLPDFAFRFSGLKTLNLADNHLTTLDDLSRFPKLTALDVRHNAFPPRDYRTLAKAIADLPRISAVHADADFLEIFAPEMNYTYSLRILWDRIIVNRDIVHLVDFESLTQRSQICGALTSRFTQKHLGQIRELNLSSKGMRVFPKEIVHLSGLKSLDLFHNDLQDLPDEFAHLLQLETVILEQNPLRPECYEKLTRMFRSMPRLTAVIYPPKQFLPSQVCILM